jgi:dTDP-4-dehydrorhamnose reductase
MNRILLFGSDGQIGSRLAQLLTAPLEVVRCGRSEADLSDASTIRNVIRGSKPDVIINVAAYTAVDQAEKEPALARAVNAIAPGVMAEEAARLKSLLVHFSTDYVFDGRKSGPYTEEDTPAPLNVYGQSKLEGELHIQAADADYLILRTSWVYDSRGRNFLLTMLRLGRERDELRIVNDQTGIPNWAQAVAETVVDAMRHRSDADGRARLKGIYHVSAKGPATWFEFARAIFAHPKVARMSKVPRLVPITTADYPTPARRPVNSVLGTGKLEKDFGVISPPWQEGLDRCLRTLSGGPQ